MILSKSQIRRAEAQREWKKDWKEKLEDTFELTEKEQQLQDRMEEDNGQT